MTSSRHSLLRRQLRKFFGTEAPLPPQLDTDAFDRFLEAVNTGYHQSDEDRRMLERSLDLSSQELLQANSDLRAVLEDFLDLYYRIDRDGTILDCRVGQADSLLLSGRDLIGRSIHSITHGSVGDLFSSAIDRVLETAALQTIEYEIETQEGEPEHFTASLIPLLNQQIAVAIQNNTEVHRFHSREQALQTRLAAAERMESLGLLAGGVAHDLNNILGPLVAYPDLIAAEIGDHPRALQDITAIKASARRAAAVVQDLLTMARRGVPVTEVINVNRLIKEVSRAPVIAENQGRKPNLEIQLNLDFSLPTIEASGNRLGQAILNLILNAIEATPDRGQITVSSRSDRVEADDGISCRPGPYVVIEVRDTGQGIEPADLDHIFEPFYSKKKLGRSGSGLGLAVVWGVVHDLDGAITVSSDSRGTTFSLFLHPSLAHEEKTKISQSIQGGQETLLVVDDEPAQRILAKRLLESLGYLVHTADSGRQAVEMVTNEPIDLLVLDMVMEEDFDGLDTWRAVRGQNPELRCIIASGYAESERVTQAWKEGAGPKIQKPYTREELALAVRQELDRERETLET